MNIEHLRSILNEVKSIAIVGASANPDRDSFKVMQFLQNYGFEIFPVNPNLVNTKILGQECYPSLEVIEQDIDMVDVFRAIKFIPSTAHEAIRIRAKILWAQEGLYSEEAEAIAKKAGLKVVMNECPKKILEN